MDETAPVRPPPSLWSATASAAPALASLAGAQRAQVAVIGAGYTGLSAGLHLAAAGCAVLVLEGAGLGEGASGLNGGQVIPGLKTDPDTLEAMFGGGLGARLVAQVAAAPDLVFELVSRHGIACDATRSGWIQAASAARDLEPLARRVEQWRRRGAPVELLSRGEVGSFIGSERYHGGLLDRRGGTVQPLSYLRGLARALLAAGGRIFSGTPATHLRPSTGAWRIDTPGGSVIAETVIVATNAYSGRLLDGLRRSVVAVPSFQVATAPLPAALRAAILTGGQAASDTCHLLRYFRVDAGGRVVLGSRGVFGATPGPHSTRPHYRAVHEIYPQLAGVSFEHHWGGSVAMTRDHLPHLHELAPGLLAGLGYNGRGVAMATLMGRLLAQRALGAPAAELGFPVTPLRPIPLHRLSRVAAGAAILCLRAADRVARIPGGLGGRRP
jgi:glycine/D-amino acid oxidase-like deaminating enzyme